MVQQQYVFLSCGILYLVKGSVRTPKRYANRCWKFVYWLDVWLRLVPGYVSFELWWSSALSPPKLGGDVDTMSPDQHA